LALESLRAAITFPKLSKPLLILMPKMANRTFFLNLSNCTCSLESLAACEIDKLELAGDELVLVFFGLHFDENDEDGMGPRGRVVHQSARSRAVHCPSFQTVLQLLTVHHDLLCQSENTNRVVFFLPDRILLIIASIQIQIYYFTSNVNHPINRIFLHCKFLNMTL
jgi:hypothetical protein